MDMPIPFIVGGIAVAAAITGVKKGIDAKNDMNEANEVNEAAKAMAKEAEEFITMAKDKTKGAIEALGQEKIRILSTSVNDFVMNFEKIKEY